MPPEKELPNPRDVGVLLVTGAPGWLADRLLASLAADPPRGLTRVRCLVNGAQALTGTLYKECAGAPVEAVRGDLRDMASLRAAVRGVDSVVHGAAIMHVKRIAEYYDINTEGTRRLAEAAADARVGRFVYVSSNAAGGKSDSKERLLTEDDPSRPLSHYGRSKWLGEVAMFGLDSSMGRVALRPSMFYGPPVPPRHVDIFRRVIHGRMPLVGGGDFARSVTHVENLVQGVRLALVHPAAAGRTYYIADRQVHTTRGVVEAMARALGVRPRWIRLPGPVASLAFEADDQISRLGYYWQTMHLVGEANWHVGLSIERAQRELGFDPLYAIDQGMADGVAWCRKEGLLL